MQLLNDASGRDTELLADIDARDLVLAVDLRRRTRRLATLVGAVRAGGAQVMLLTDAPVSDLEHHAAVVLRCPTHATQLFDSYVGPVSLVNFLAADVAARAAGATRERLARIEDLHGTLADLAGDYEAERKKQR